MTPQDYSALYLGRWRDQRTDGYLSELLPDQQVRETVANRIASTVALANEVDPSRWGLTRLRKGLRLNVGPAEALLVDSYMTNLMVDSRSIEAKGLQDLVARLKPTIPHSSVPGSVFVSIPHDPPDALVRTIALLNAPHSEHVCTAPMRGLNGSTRRGHDPLLVEQAAAAAEKALPQPAYVQMARALDTARKEDSVPAQAAYPEGCPTDVVQTSYERDRGARRACLAYYGHSCVVCGCNFGERYGALAEGLIHVHHLHPFGEGAARDTNPIADLRPVCPNCHLVIHSQVPALSIDDERARLSLRR